MLQSFHIKKKFMQTICTKRNTSTEKFLPPPQWFLMVGPLLHHDVIVRIQSTNPPISIWIYSIVFCLLFEREEDNM